MRFKKIKLTKEGKIHLEYEVKKSNNKTDEIALTCSDEPKPEFGIALQDLAPDVIDLCELPEEYLTRITVSGVSFSYGGDKEVMGATIIAQMNLKKSNVALNLITPHKAEEFYADDGDPKQLLDEDCVDRLKGLTKEAEEYVRGIRAQGDLFGLKEDLQNIAKDFHDDMQKGLGPEESVTISSGGKSTTIKGKHATA